MPIPLRGCLAILLVVSHVRAQSQPAADALVADFEEGRAVALRVNGASATITPGDAAQGDRFLRLTPASDEAGKAYVRLPLPARGELFRHERLTAQLRTPATQSVKLRWLALDADGRPIFQRQFALEPGEKWVRLASPLRAWFWDQRRVGDWDEVTELALRIDSPGVLNVDLDDVRLEGRAEPDAQTNWLLDLAFGPDRPRKVVTIDGLMVASDVDAFTEPDLRRLLDDMTRTRAFVRRLFGDAVRPTDDIGAPASLLIFADDATRAAFLRRIGDAWGATIAPPTGQGYTIQDIATATYRQDLGVRRPVYLHESTHAIVARDLRLLTGHAPHSPLQEGIANYVQLCVHPKSIDRADYARAFDRPIDLSGKGFFVPLDQIFATRATTRHYAQLASVVAYLVERNEPLLRDLAKSLADGQSASEVLARRGTSWEALQNAWLAWGREHFGGAAADAIFDCPPEFR